MAFHEFHYRWEFKLESSPEQLWPLVADTNRFNRDTGVPAVESLSEPPSGKRNLRRRMRLSAFGMAVEWEEQPFEWVRPHRFGVLRRYTRGPVAELRVLAELTPSVRESHDHSPGTRLVYEIWVRPRNLLGLIVVPIQIGLIAARNFARTFTTYDKLVRSEPDHAIAPANIEFASGGRARLLSLSRKLIDSGASATAVAGLVDHIENADDFALGRIRPYELADRWQAPRREVLENCLWATRVGLLDLQWRLLCPMCRGGSTAESLQDVTSNVHCSSCKIDFTLNLDHLVELTFRPNPAIRKIEVDDYCVGGPQLTPHIVAQQLLDAGAERCVQIALEPGRYRLRTLGLTGSQDVMVAEGGETSLRIQAKPAGWTAEQSKLAKVAEVTFENATDAEQLFILERTAWNDQAATAAEVTALQVFRDLFASEALRPGEQISVGTLAVLFTDLRNSTRMYREIGDATAFGRVMNHFDILRQAIADEDGALVKTIGDAVMAVFRHPAAALRAMLRAQQLLAVPQDGNRPLTLKAGIHVGPCIAVTLNGRLDYFGSTVNLAARLEGQSTGDDVVISTAVYSDPEVRELLDDADRGLAARRFEIPLKGFDEDSFELWRVQNTSG